VTTDIACAGGRELWGFPKFVTDIGFSLTQSGFRCTVKDPDTDTQIVDIHGKPGMGIPAPQLDLVLYSIREKEMLRSLAITRGGGRLSLPGSLRLHLGKSEHPMAQRLQALGLDALKPVLVFHSQSLQLRLNAGVTTAQKRRHEAPFLLQQHAANYRKPATCPCKRCHAAAYSRCKRATTSAAGTVSLTAPMPWPLPQISFHALAPPRSGLSPKSIIDGSPSGRLSGSRPDSSMDRRR